MKRLDTDSKAFTASPPTHTLVRIILQRLLPYDDTTVQERRPLITILEGVRGEQGGGVGKGAALEVAFARLHSGVVLSLLPREGSSLWG